MKVLIVFLLVFSLQFPAIADCPLPEYNLSVPQTGSSGCDNANLSNDFGCQPWSFEGIAGSWSECLDESRYRVYFLYDYYWDYTPYGGSQQWHDYHVYHIDSFQGEPFANPEYPAGGGGDKYSGSFNSESPYYLEKIAPLLGTIVNAHYQCWCPPPVCIFPQCIGEEISQVFPFDIFLNIPAAAINCPSVTFFGQLYDLCWLYELLRWFKYPIAVSLLIKLAMHL